MHSWRLIGKCLRPLPDKWKGLTDPEARVRSRYVDLAINTESRELITARSAISTPFAKRSSSRDSWKSKHRFCNRFTAARRPARS